MRRTLSIAVVTALTLALGPVSTAGARKLLPHDSNPARRSAVTTFTPRWHRLARDAQVLTAGPLRLLETQTVELGLPSPSGVLTNVITGQRTTVTPPAGCQITALGQSAIVFSCDALSAPLIVDHLATGLLQPVDELGQPVAVGSIWLQTSVTGPEEHSAPAFSFTNLVDGVTVPDPSRVGATTYPDLDAPGLTATACAPVRLAGAMYQSTVPITPGALVFVGDLAIHTNVLHTGWIGVQRCGSRTIHRFETVQFADNERMLVWIGHAAGVGVLSGLRAATDTPFQITAPARIFQASPNAIAVDADDVYLMQSTPVPAVWVARLPPSLRG